ncbi:DUF3267 domain-containing protein [Tenuibacillus multivorans]|uniref:Putative zincin peptidase n=1 Tax=Tenuibacillus multivorans TaxID=237069 RepID=A0A1H0A5E2_9BACI|nr:DUF3267 domain-containing protein [Tenuibacillus multivorans]GEL78395.1 putative membrane protein YhaJ [Tenuibacillus multivorans]SDN28675.1 Putative zincin peptidase [Tenuibacillus multivorans]
MTCWKTINITKELGYNRLIILSTLLGISTFILMYVPFSIIYQGVNIKAPSIYIVLSSLVLIPVLHKLAHAIPLLFTDKEFQFRWGFKNKYIPNLKIMMKSSLSKRTSIIMMLAPTIFITLPLMLALIAIPVYYPVVILCLALNIGMSLQDFIVLAYFARAPKNSVIEKSREDYDILVQSQ